MATDPRQRFAAVAAGYDRYRPGYPAALLDWIVAAAGVGPGARVADLGCGTGIFSRLLAARGLDVVGVEPNEAMLAQARAAGGGPSYRRGEAAATGLDGGSVALATAAQAFHWFELEPTRRELARILAPGGLACAVWNLRSDGPFTDDYERLLLDSSSEYQPYSDSIDPRAPLRGLPGARLHELANDQRLTLDEVLGRARSTSYVHHGVADLARFEQRLRDLHARHAAPDGTVLWSMRTVAIAWPL